MNELVLRKNQIDAINKSVENDFKSGIHNHATGTGKSWIAIHIAHQFNIKYPKKNILWLCERKDILKQQFSKETLKNRGFEIIFKKFNVINFVDLKNDKWYDSLNSSKFWGKPFLCIINRAYLTTMKKYENINATIDLVIHDECHSIENKTTQNFYKWLFNKVDEPKVIGFSATPEILKPLDNLLSKYSIYQAFIDKVVLPPKIVWIKSRRKSEFIDVIEIIKKEISQLPYKKIIVWCGIIEECIKAANKWKEHFQDFDFCLDFNNIDKNLNEKNNKQKNLNNFKTYQDFYEAEKKTILFCAVKHREGSDIPNIDGCIFMDMVEKRSQRVFVQCIGRVLRKDAKLNKKYGLIIDLKAKSTIEICNRIQYYLQLKNIFPWKYSMSNYETGSNTYFINYLDMVNGNKKILDNDNVIIYDKDDIIKYFTREIPDDIKYKKRLEYEIKLILEKGLFKDMLRALEILKLTENIPHITRGSCGSSLVCYLLGISHVDPVKHKISFARFLNRYRNNLPDIDFDFPHYMRDEVFLKLYQKWGDNVARISNHNYYHEKSALREALRKNGIRKFISKYDLDKEINSYDKELKDSIFEKQKELEGTFRCFSLHCGGIIYYPDGIPEELIINNHNSIIKQVNLDKRDVTEYNNFKIDILSSRGLSQLYYCNSFKPINFDQHIGDQKTIDLLSSGNNIGITLAETPLMRKALLLIKPKSIMDLAICLSIIRPAAKDAKKEFEISKYSASNIIFDDDVIEIISKLINCDEEMADKIRREYCKSKDGMDVIEEYLLCSDIKERNKIRSILSNLRKYGFCKAHAISYAQLVWQLAYQKANFPKRFWKSTLKNVKSCYRNWVHIYEAKCHDISTKICNKEQSIYALCRNKKIEEENHPIEQLRKYGYWIMKDDQFYKNCYCFENNSQLIFKGLIASSRIINFGKYKKLILFIGVSKQCYKEIIVNQPFSYNSNKVIIKGKGIMKNELYQTIECKGRDIEFI